MQPGSLPIVLLHGLGCDPYLWHPVEMNLTQAGFEVLQPQMRDQESIEEMARHVLAQLEGPFVLGGLSMGGYVSLEIWRQAPERVQALLLCDTNYKPETPERRQAREQAMNLVRQGKFEQMARLFRDALTAPAYLEDESRSQALLEMIRRTPPEAYLRQQTAILTRADSSATLATIQCPTLILCGELDQMTPPELHRHMAEAIPNARLELIPGAGHLAPLEAGSTVGPLIRNWLLQLPD